MIYIASPYTHREQRIRVQRFNQTVALVAALQVRHPRKILFSPIIHCHPIDRAQAGKMDYTFWINWSSELLDRADSMWVLCMPDWKTSRGIQAEIMQCSAAGKPVLYVDYQLLEVTDDPK
jgi:hypothetical protein